jgi:succinate dehydrogenase / fumarate reductase cytochrome b subunit
MHDGKEIRDLYQLVYDAFSNGWYVLWYELALLFLAFHVSHGFWSAFQSLGISHPVYTPFLQRVAVIFAVVIGGGFLSIPLYIFLSTGGF